VEQHFILLLFGAQFVLEEFDFGGELAGVFLQLGHLLFAGQVGRYRTHDVLDMHHIFRVFLGSIQIVNVH